ncbi:putative ternary complex factor MIP1, leucine-zipper [Helianthus annuus]|nr:putative ternary complex factor MIP1, leucine-zipper [Helianthus annuus]KAJ0935692.1 putative ternary complex factor MIP1, leucine-zipper [Helianthus annuus]KAJ0943611.1 putative ternary complex factor MIP1, leucine-zipper [Helianthus annuus]
MGFGGSSHKRKKSDLGNRRIHDDKNAVLNASQQKMERSCERTEKRRFESIEAKNSLKEEIEQLQKQLEDQLTIRSELEKATTSQPFFQDPVDEASLTKSSKDLIKEISILEFEVKHLEKYLLSLYRKTFQKKEQQSLSATDTKSRLNAALKEQQLLPGNSANFMPARASTDNPPKDCFPILESQPMEDSNVNRSHSSLSYRTPPLYMAVNQAVESYHSLPLGMLEFAKDDHSSVSLAEHLGGCISDNVRMSANCLSEEMIKCISSIYGQIADPPLFNHEFPSSPISFPSPPSDSSPIDQFSMWSPHCEGSMEFSGPYFTTLEVQGFCKTTQRLSSVEHKQQNFRSLILKLEHVDPRKLKHEEKLAFWINVHNALVMHAYLVHGTPRGALKRISLVQKAAYNIGGHNLSVGDIQSTILGCRLPHPGQWFQSLLFQSPKYKSRDARKAYAMKHPQPLAYFALCSGSHSDPMVRVYTPKSVFQELEIAKEEYIHTNFKIQKGQKIYLPKLVDLYAKESGLCHTGLVDMIEHSVPDCYQDSFKSIRKGKSLKKFEWVPHDFTFRYLLSPDLAK